MNFTCRFMVVSAFLISNSPSYANEPLSKIKSNQTVAAHQPFVSGALEEKYLGRWNGSYWTHELFNIILDRSEISWSDALSRAERFCQDSVNRVDCANIKFNYLAPNAPLSRTYKVINLTDEAAYILTREKGGELADGAIWPSRIRLVELIVNDFDSHRSLYWSECKDDKLFNAPQFDESALSDEAWATLLNGAINIDGRNYAHACRIYPTDETNPNGWKWHVRYFERSVN